MIDELLEKAGLKYEDLNPAEKETLNVWMEALQKGQMSVEKIKDYITSMREAVEDEISKCPIFVRVFVFKFENPKLVQLQARLRNYMLLDAYLSSPVRAKQQMESAIAGMVGKKTV